MPVKGRTERGRSLPHLRDFPWWPTGWERQEGGPVSAQQILEAGVLRNVRRLTNGLLLEVEHEGTICLATVESPDLTEDDLILLRHILLQYYGGEMRIIANLSFDLPVKPRN